MPEAKIKSIGKPICSVQQISADSNGNLPKRVQILRAGNYKTQKYGPMDIRLDDLIEMKNNFDRGIGLAGGGGHGAPVNFGHRFGEEAGAWMMGLEVDEAEQALYANLDYTDVGEAAIKGKRYKFFSAEFWLRSMGQIWRDSENSDITATNVLDGGAFTNIPLFNGQKAVTASRGDSEEEGLLYIQASAIKEDKMVTLEETRKKQASELSEEERELIVAHKDELTDEEKTRFGLSVASQDKKVGEETLKNEPVAASAVKGDEGNVVMAAKEVVELREKAQKAGELETRVGDLENSVKASAEKEAQAFVKTHAARGAIKADQVETWTKMVVADATNKEVLAALPDNPELAAEAGSNKNAADATDALAELDKATLERIAAAKKEGKTLQYGDAQNEVLASNKDLKERVEAQRASR